jgi:hypothetical protein
MPHEWIAICASCRLQVNTVIMLSYQISMLKMKVDKTESASNDLGEYINQIVTELWFKDLLQKVNVSYLKLRKK